MKRLSGKDLNSPFPTPSNWPVIGVCVFLALAVLAVFGQTAHFEFLRYDDHTYVFENPVVQRGLSLAAVGWAFTHAQVSNWIPLTTLSHMLDCDLFGLRAGGHHLVNVLLHAANAVLLFLVLRQITGRLWRSAFVAAVFAVHPLRAESVAWIAERKDVLSGCFFLLTIAAYLRQVRRPSRVNYIVMLGLFALGLMAKSMVATLPGVLLLLDYWPLGRIRNRTDLARLALEKIPLLAIAAVVSVVAALMPGLIVARRTPLLERVENALISYVIYLRQMVFPTDLAAHYPNPAPGPAWWEAGLALVLLTAISAAVVLVRQKRPFLLAGWLWYLGMLFPVIGIVQISSDAAHADRYTYLPEIGLAVAATWCIGEWTARWRNRRLILGGLAVAALAVLSVVAREQVSTWRNDESLWTRALACTSDNFIAHNGLGVALAGKGEYDAAIAEYHQALKINPGYAVAHFDLADALAAKGDLDGAIAEERLTLALNPDTYEAWNNLGAAQFKKGEKEEAVAQYRKALEIKPDGEQALFNLGNALLQSGHPEEAIAHLRHGLAINPGFADGLNNLGICLCLTGAYEQAIPQFRRALQLDPNDLEARCNLANAFVKTGNLPEAMAQYGQILAKNPSHATALRGLAKALLRQGDFDGALASFQKTMSLSPDPVTRWIEFGNALLRSADTEEAVICFQAALKLNAQSPVALDGLGSAFARLGKARPAADTWRQALQISPNATSVQNHLAWLLATTADASLRDGPTALLLATQANQATGDKNPTALRTLAAAYAESGRYADAAATARRAVEIAAAQKNESVATKLTKEVKLYEGGQAMREDAR